LTAYQHDLTLRPITGRDELDLFNRLPYVLNDEVGNAPMAAAFAGAGYVIFERQIDMTWR
jgi:hypothetical protein